MKATIWRRKLSAVVLGATLAAATAVATPAIAGPADLYAALAYSESTGSYGMAWGVTEMISGKEESGWGMAAGTALAKCKSNGASDCEGQAKWAKNGCVAVAILIDFRTVNMGVGPTQEAALTNAMAPLGGPSATQVVCASTTPAGSKSGILQPPTGPGPGGEQPPPSKITLRYDPPTLVGITAFVGITNNANKPAAACNYSDGVTPARPFTVTGSAESRVDIAGIPTGTTYHVTVTCDGGLTHSEDKTF